MRRVLPICLVVNASRSVVSRLVEVQHVLTALSDVLLYSPLLGDRVRVCGVSFAETARCVLRLMADIEFVPDHQGLAQHRRGRDAGHRTLLRGAEVHDLIMGRAGTARSRPDHCPAPDRGVRGRNSGGARRPGRTTTRSAGRSDRGDRAAFGGRGVGNDHQHHPHHVLARTIDIVEAD